LGYSAAFWFWVDIVHSDSDQQWCAENVIFNNPQLLAQLCQKTHHRRRGRMEMTSRK
jgi:hypothetical protein